MPDSRRALRGTAHTAGSGAAPGGNSGTVGARAYSRPPQGTGVWHRLRAVTDHVADTTRWQRSVTAFRHDP
ncbi:hypothetical protein [Streptomyces sp. NPDC102490]|uniref:hypothetical protein n=1 Tax=Streptomyces sp. NPDC102490 TaxID=3366183 RepID=UPI003826F1F2